MREYSREGHHVAYESEMGDDNENPFFEAAIKATIGHR